MRKALLPVHLVLSQPRKEESVVLLSAADCVTRQAVKCLHVCGSLSQHSGPLTLPGEGKCLRFISDRGTSQLLRLVCVCVSSLIFFSLHC